jgi:hypothetical protein
MSFFDGRYILGCIHSFLVETDCSVLSFRLKSLYQRVSFPLRICISIVFVCCISIMLEIEAIRQFIGRHFIACSIDIPNGISAPISGGLCCGNQ